MKNITVFLAFLMSLNVTAQKTDERPIKIQVGDCLTKSTYLLSRGDKSIREFIIEVPQDGNYYLEVLLLVSGSSEYEIGIDGKTKVGVFKSNKNSWQFVSLLNDVQLPQSIPLTKGQHIVSFSVAKPYAPLIDVISLSRNGTGTVLDQKITNDYLTKLGSTKLSATYEANKKSGKSNKRILANPEGQYLHEIDYTYSTTTTVQYWLQGGQSYVFKTDGTNTDPVMYVFAVSSWAQGSWSDDDGAGNLNPQVSFTPSVTGYYAVLLKTYGPASAGIADLYFNGSKVMDDVPVSGSWYSIAQKGGDLNFFTSHASGSPSILVANSETSPALAYNDFYYPWYSYSGNSQSYSRIRGNFNGQVAKVMPTTSSMYNPNGTCDLYMNCEMVTNGYIFTSYPNLNPDDAIKAANSGINNYNCYAWAAGISPNGNIPPGSTGYWNYPPNEVIAGYPADGTPLGSMDAFLGNNPPRYAGAWTYTRSGADANNATIALWATSSYYTHLSIRKPGNDHPHGYDWESKMSGDERMMHPKNAIAGNQLGQIVAYYRVASSGGRLSAENGRIGAAEGISLQESLERGLSVLEEQQWTNAETELLKKLTEEIPVAVREEFTTLYQRWVEMANTPAVRSTTDQQSYKKLAEYINLAKWVRQNNTTGFPLLFNEFLKEPVWAIDAIIDLTATPYRFLWKEVSEENRKNLYDERGRYLVRSQSTNCARYIKKMLNLLQTADKMQIDLLCSPNPVSDIATIAFYLPTAATVSLQIASERGLVVNTLLQSKPMSAGWQQVVWNGKNNEGTKLQMGVYPITPITENQRKTIHVVVQ
jgi:hypothetical protein